MKKQYIFSASNLLFCILNSLYASETALTMRETLEEPVPLHRSVVSPKTSLEILEDRLFNLPQPKTFPDAVAISRALLKAEADYFSSGFQESLQANPDSLMVLYNLGFKTIMETLNTNLEQILKGNGSNLAKARKIKEAIDKIKATNKKAVVAFKFVDPQNSATKLVLLDFIQQHLIQPFTEITETSEVALKVLPKQEKKESRNVWLPPELLKQKKSGQNRGKKKNVTSGRNQKNNTKKSLGNRAELLSKASLPDEAIQNPETKEELSFSPLLREPLGLTPEEQHVSHSVDKEIRETADKLLGLLLEEKAAESAVQEPLPSVSPQGEIIILEEVNDSTPQYPIKNNKKKVTPKQKTTSKNETPEAEKNDAKKILVKRSSWDAMVKIRKLRAQPLYNSEFNNKVPLKDIYKLISECNGIIAPGGKSNINLAIPSLNPKHKGKWNSTSIHNLHSDRALFLPPNTEHWWSRVENLLIESGIGPETIETM